MSDSNEVREWIAMCAALGAAANPDATEADIERAVNAALDEYEAQLAAYEKKKP